jgi:DNA-binding NarL/FixJ family response regulator
MAHRYFTSSRDPTLRLTEHAVTIITQLSYGKKASEVGADLGIATDTVYEVIEGARRRLGARSTAELVRLGIHHGFVDA